MFNKNQIIKLIITDMGVDGEGIAKESDFTFFVKDALIGDEIEARVIKLKKNYGYARVERVIKPSPFRVEPACKDARRCGGCQIMELEYSRQLMFKENKVINNMIRIGGFDRKYIEQITEPIIGMENPYHYRNKAQFPFGIDKDGNFICGFYAGRTHSIISNTDCALGISENKIILEMVLEYMKKYHIKPYDENTKQGLIRHLLIRKGFNTGELMVCFIVNSNKKKVVKEILPQTEELIDELAKIPGMKSISVNYNNQNTNVIMGKETECIWGNKYIEDTISVKIPGKENKEPELIFEISPLSFFQVNPVQVEKLYGTAIEFADLTGKEEVWDICCGIGTITLSVSGKAKMVHGIEIVPEAIEDAKRNAIKNGIKNVDFICDAAESYFPLNSKNINADIIIMDPPRKGMDVETLKVVADVAPQKIVYVSCDSATLARDVKYLCENGYELKRIRPCDMFPHTAHVETVCLLSRKAPV